VPIEELSPVIRQFISRYVRSVEQLEILLLLWNEPETIWSVDAVYTVILSTPASVERWLDELVRQGLVNTSLEPAGYKYSPSSAAVAEEVTALAKLYKTVPVRVIEAVYKPRTDAAQTFADAFKLKNPDPS
jgi:DNA-binding MarR family transcriptional regulator